LIFTRRHELKRIFDFVHHAPWSDAQNQKFVSIRDVV